MSLFSEKKFADQKSPDKFRLLFEYSSDAHFIMVDGVITDCNEAAAPIETVQAIENWCQPAQPHDDISILALDIAP